jgi:hypothetical protein
VIRFIEDEIAAFLRDGDASELLVNGSAETYPV